MSFLEFLNNLKMECGDDVKLSDGNGKDVRINELLGFVTNKSLYYKSLKEQKVMIICSNSVDCLVNILATLVVGIEVVLIDAHMEKDNISEIANRLQLNRIFIASKEKKLLEELKNKGFIVESFDDVNKKCLKIDDLSDEVGSDLTNFKDGKMVIFTSGTTGKAKGIVLDIGKIIINGEAVSKCIANDVCGSVYVPVPLSHLYFYVMLFLCFYQKRSIYIGNVMRQKKELALIKPAIYVATPSMVQFIIKNMDFVDESLYIATSGGRIRSSIINELESIHDKKITIQNIYGSTEFGGSIAISKIGEDLCNLNFLQYVNVKENNEGILIKSPTNAEGYYDGEGKYILLDEWIDQGDLWEKKQDGSYKILGRADDRIALSNGMNVILGELEDKIIRNAKGVQGCCVMYDEKEKALIGIIQTLDEELVKKSLEDFNTHQSYYERIMQWHFQKGSLPYNTNGKLDRNKIKQMYGID